jgi:hypothetical protein
MEREGVDTNTTTGSGPEDMQAGTASWFLKPGRAALVALAAYGAFLWFFRPVNPFEWDELLAQRAVTKYDVATHSPQPPGFPAYIGAAKAVNFLVHDPLQALQIVGILAALAAVAATWALARRLGAPPALAAGAAGMVAASPEFFFMAVVGTSDVAGTASGVVAALALVAAAQNPALLPLAGAVCGVAVGIRPQNMLVGLPALIWALTQGVRARRWGRLVVGALVGLAVTAAAWVPAILVTGPQRWWWAITKHIRYMGAIETPLHLPKAHLTDILQFWFLNSFVDWKFAAPLWLLVVVGIFVLVRSGHGWIAALAGSAAGLWIVGALFTLNETVSLRYILPAVPFLAILAAGGLAAASTIVRRAVGTLLVLWCVVAVAWASPAYRERLKPSPVWAALTWIREHCNPGGTKIVYDGVVTPQVEYVLASNGFQIVEMGNATLFDTSVQPGEQTLFVTPLPVPGAELLFEAHHSTGRVVQLAWGRYESCAVSRVRNAAAVFSPEWQLRKDGWQLFGTGRIHLPVGSRPALVRLCAGWETITLKRPGGAVEAIKPTECVMVPLQPGPTGALAVSAPGDSATLIPPIQLLPMAALESKDFRAPAFMVPQVAHLAGFRSSFWRTDLVLINPQMHPLPVAAAFLPTGRDNVTGARAGTTLEPGQVLVVPDVLTLPQFQGQGKLGAMIVWADPPGLCTGGGCDFLVLSRTYNTSAGPGAWRADEWLPGVAAASALRSGEKATFSHISRDDAKGMSVGVASWSDVAVRVRVRVLDKAGATVEERGLELGRFGHLHVPLDAVVDDGRLEVEVVAPRAGAMVVPYISMVEESTGLPTHLLPDSVPARTPPERLLLPPPSAAPKS